MSDQEEVAYRRDGEVWCIDLRLKQLRQLYDLRDPAPFNERDLDPGAAEYLRELLKEGLTIGAWVAIWRPVEHFLYDWWPFLQERRMLTRLASLSVRVHWGARGPTVAGPLSLRRPEIRRPEG